MHPYLAAAFAIVVLLWIGWELYRKFCNGGLRQMPRSR
jgi:hypothetical protein